MNLVSFHELIYVSPELRKGVLTNECCDVVMLMHRNDAYNPKNTDDQFILKHFVFSNVFRAIFSILATYHHRLIFRKYAMYKKSAFKLHGFLNFLH